MTQQDPLRKLYGKQFKAGDIIFREGDPGEKFYLIQAGKVRIVKDHGKPHEATLTTFSKGDFFGEMALFDTETRSATAVCDEPTEAYELGQKNFENFVMQRPRVAYEVIQKLCTRVRHMNELTAELRRGADVPKVGSVTETRVSAPAPEGDVYRSLAAVLMMVLASGNGRRDGAAVRVSVPVDPDRAGDLYGFDTQGVAELFQRLAAATQEHSDQPPPEVPAEAADSILANTRLELTRKESRG